MRLRQLENEFFYAFVGAHNAFYVARLARDQFLHLLLVAFYLDG